MKIKVFFVLFAVVTVFASAVGAEDTTPVYTYSIVNSFPHDPEAFTQGLVFDDGFIYESTGRRGSSTLRKVELETGNVLQVSSLPFRLFGEGITIRNDIIVGLTWRARVGFIYDKETFNLLRTVLYRTEGWGITHDGDRLIMSDGTSKLYFRDAASFRIIGAIDVHDGDDPVNNLNELEYVNGEIFANVWMTDRIARIDPVTGRVAGWIELKGLLSEQDRSQPVDVLNGIAYDADDDRLFVTGKLWPKLFEIKVEERHAEKD